jgi:hypothetical protein
MRFHYTNMISRANLYFLKFVYFTVYETLWKLVLVKFVWRFLMVDFIWVGIKDFMYLSYKIGHWGLQLKLNKKLGYYVDYKHSSDQDCHYYFSIKKESEEFFEGKWHFLKLISFFCFGIAYMVWKLLVVHIIINYLINKFICLILLEKIIFTFIEECFILITNTGNWGYLKNFNIIFGFER